MNKEEYDLLNDHLNDCLLMLSINDSFYINNIINISELNNKLKNKLEKISTLNIESPYLELNGLIYYSRRLIADINPSFIPKFDDAINNGIIDFNYDHFYNDSHYVIEKSKNGQINFQEININRNYNYSDIIVLIHEFMHYINTSENNCINNHVLSEYVSIFFELYIKKMLLSYGVAEKYLLSFYKRLNNIYYDTNMMNKYQYIFMAYIQNGNIDANSYQFFHEFNICDITQEELEDDCHEVLNYLTKYNANFKNRITTNYKYILGSILAYYSLKNNTKEDVLKLMTFFKDRCYNSTSLIEILQLINIDLLNISNDELLKPIYTEIDNYYYHLNNKLIKKI